MEGRVGKKVNDYQLNFKNNIQKFIETNDLRIVDSNGSQATSELLKFIFDYDNINLSNDDFKKRKRIKNQVPQYERCIACRANGEQCTRRRKDDHKYCGTHAKGIPHGQINIDDNKITSIKKIEVWVQDINGIDYYIDANKNVYLPQDILSNSNKPRIIGKWHLDSNKNYSIPALDEYKTQDN